MDKEFDYEDFKNFMNHFRYDWQVQALDNRANTFDIIETQDEIEEAIQQMTEFPEAVEMLTQIGISCD